MIFKHAIATVTSTALQQPRRPQSEGEQPQRPPTSFAPPQQFNRKPNE
ncbi:MAG: hypothetical protein ABI954_01290 [Pyrinomonadaceae bacterium]